MIEVTHRPDGAGWAFSCASVFAVQGGGKSLEASVDAAEHSVRHYLSHGGHPVLPGEAHRQIRHMCDGRSAGGPLRDLAETGHALQLVLS